MMKDYRSEKSETKGYKIASKVKEIMDILEIEETESTKDTPKRVAKMYVDEVFRNVNNYALDELKMTTFKKEGGMNEMVIVRDIPYYSMCELH
ncbi:MAG: GTP cyclohydrolase I, partial [Peptostreptococcaceae bacterium]